MYELKTLLPQFEINLPTCMYPLKNVSLAVDAAQQQATAATATSTSSCSSGKHHNNNNTTLAAATPTNCAAYASSASSPSSKSKSSACVLDLDVLGAQIQQLLLKSAPLASDVTLRQERVLEQLSDLKKQLAGMRSTLGLCAKPAQNTPQKKRSNGGLREEPLHDIVINGHPNFIPYALLAMKNAWRDLYTIDVKTFTHSTMPDIGAEARAFEQALAAVPVDASKPKINVSLIWKNCEHTEMISSPTMYVPIYGEVNIIRYLGRVGPADYRYEDSPLATEIDAVLDICYQLLRCTTAKARATMLRALNQRLQKQQFFGGDQMSVADIGVHSSLKRMPSIVEKDLTPALSAWRKRAQLVTLI